MASALQDLRRAAESSDEELLTATLRRYVESGEQGVVAQASNGTETGVPTLTVVGES